ncbi:MAG: proline--tRNA ligase [Thaumarchaeota archaeon]|nr:proline--tRNA ligase [Nitrososphaerota archaeon]MCY3975700.1 proline--tRNA ligase [Nitrososphaerota archaeon]
MIKSNHIKFKKANNFSDWYVEILIKSEFVDYSPIKGFMVLRPNGYEIWEFLQDIINKKLKKSGHRNAFLPILIPENLLVKEKNHFNGFNPEVFWVSKYGNSNKLALRPTSETLAYFFYSKWIKSWRDLPLKLNFWNTALRAEIKSTKPFLRTSEFLWQEGHTAHATQKEAENEVYDILFMYKNIIENELAIPVIIGKKTNKEKFVGAVYTTALESIMPDGKSLQMGTSHLLGQNFSKPFKIKFLDKSNVENYVWQTSWGVSWRLIGAMIMIHGDDKGIILPPRISPIQVIIIPIYYSLQELEKILAVANKIQNALVNKNVRIEIDKRDNVTPGFKFNYWELRGIPLRIEIGPSDMNKQKFVLVNRYTKEKKCMNINELDEIVNILETIQNAMFNYVKKSINEKIVEVKNYEQFKIHIKNGKSVMAPLCKNELCEMKIKQETNADVRVITFNKTNSSKKCIYCNSRCSEWSLFGHGY